jgi:hypothetical protein
VQMIDRDSINQINDLFTAFMADPALTAADTQAKFVEIIKNAPK